MKENTELIGQCANLISQEIRKRLAVAMPYGQIATEVAKILKPWDSDIKPNTIAKRAERMPKAEKMPQYVRTNVRPESKPERPPKSRLERIQELYSQIEADYEDDKDDTEFPDFWDWHHDLVSEGINKGNYWKVKIAWQELSEGEKQSFYSECVEPWIKEKHEVKPAPAKTEAKKPPADELPDDPKDYFRCILDEHDGLGATQ